MNEPAAFDTNKEKPFNYPPDKHPWNLICPVNEWDDPPYITRKYERTLRAVNSRTTFFKLKILFKFLPPAPTRIAYLTKLFVWWVARDKMTNTFTTPFTIFTDGVKRSQLTSRNFAVAYLPQLLNITSFVYV